MILTKKTLFVVCLMLLMGCSTTHTQIIPDEGLTTAEVYYNHQRTRTSLAGGTGRTGHGRVNQPVDETYYLKYPYERDVKLFTASQITDIEQQFPVIPNQQIKGYVFPHLSSRGHPVPGYTTAFTVYERTHYALPGEVPPLRFSRRQ